MAANGNNDVIFEKYQDSFSKEEFDLLEKKFALMDDDGDGYINYSDLKAAQSKMGKFKTQKDLENIIKQSASSPKGITFAEIVSFVSLQRDDPTASGHEFRLAKDINEFDVEKFEKRSASDAGFKKVHEQYKNADGGDEGDKKVGFKDLLSRFNNSEEPPKAPDSTIETRKRSKTMPANKLEDIRKRHHARQTSGTEVPEWLKKRQEMQKRKAEKEKAEKEKAEMEKTDVAEQENKVEAVTPPPQEKKMPPANGIKKVTIVDEPVTLEKPAEKSSPPPSSGNGPDSILRKSKSNPVVPTKTQGGVNRLRADTEPVRPKARKSRSARSHMRDKVKRKKSHRTMKEEKDKHHLKAGETAPREKRRHSHKSSHGSKDRKHTSRRGESEKLFIKTREVQDSNFENFNEDTIKYIQDSQLEKRLMSNFYSRWGNKPLL